MFLIRAITGICLDCRVAMLLAMTAGGSHPKTKDCGGLWPSRLRTHSACGLVFSPTLGAWLHGGAVDGFEPFEIGMAQIEVAAFTGACMGLPKGFRIGPVLEGGFRLP